MNTKKGIGIIVFISIIIFSMAVPMSVFGQNIDSMLDDYEKLVDSLVAAYARIMSGDLSVIMEMQDLAEEYETLFEKLAFLEENDLSDAQKLRAARITEKYMKAFAGG